MSLRASKNRPPIFPAKIRKRHPARRRPNLTKDAAMHMPTPCSMLSAHPLEVNCDPEALHGARSDHAHD